MRLLTTIILLCFSVAAIAHEDEQESESEERILFENGDRVLPLSLGDDDPDYHVIACLTQTSPAISVSVVAGFFHDPGDDANPETNIDVISKMIE